MSNSNNPDPTNDDNPSKLASAGKFIGAAGQGAFNVAQNAAHGAAGLAGSALEKASGVGSAGMNLLRDHPNLLKWLKPLGAAGLMGALEKVDIDSALQTVRELQAQFPNRIARRNRSTSYHQKGDLCRRRRLGDQCCAGCFAASCPA